MNKYDGYATSFICFSKYYINNRDNFDCPLIKRTMKNSSYNFKGLITFTDKSAHFATKNPTLEETRVVPFMPTYYRQQLELLAFRRNYYSSEIVNIEFSDIY